MLELLLCSMLTILPDYLYRRLGAALPLPPSADIGPGRQSVGQAAQFCYQGSLG